MDVVERSLDLELTNRCNALCSFCPRSETPEQGFMSLDVLKQSILRAKESSSAPRVTFTGQGESTLHPNLVEFVRYAASEGVEVSMTTNANLLDKEKSRELIEAGLAGIVFSVSDFDEDYELVYNLSFAKTRTNIMDFFDVRSSFTGREVNVAISIVAHDLNRDKIEDMRAYWNNVGVNYIMEFPQSTRGGACDNANYFVGNDRFLEEAQNLLAEKKISSLCALPFFSVFIGWNGQYYICCNDYKKEAPLGSVFDYSVDAMDQIKLDAMGNNLPTCVNCNTDPVNGIRETMFEIEAGNAEARQLQKDVRRLANQNQPRLPRDIDILHWRNYMSS